MGTLGTDKGRLFPPPSSREVQYRYDAWLLSFESGLYMTIFTIKPWRKKSISLSRVGNRQMRTRILKTPTNEPP
jgi:hypothetical protein